MIANINGLNINYIQEGSGKDLLFLHGWGGRWESWYPIIQHFKVNYRVTAIDLPGFGQSDLFPNPTGLLGFTEIISGFINNLELNRPAVIGHSFGGSITATLAINYPELISRIVLADASGIRKQSLRKKVIMAAAKTGKAVFSLPILKSGQNYLRSALYNILGESDYLTAGKLKESYKIIINEDISPILAKINLPTLIIWGEKDRSTPLWQGRIFNRLIAGSKLIIIPHTGHFSYLENPEMFNESVEHFLDDRKV